MAASGTPPPPPHFNDEDRWRYYRKCHRKWLIQCGRVQPGQDLRTREQIAASPLPRSRVKEVSYESELEEWEGFVYRPVRRPKDGRLILEEERHLYQPRRRGDYRQWWDSPRPWDPQHLEAYFQEDGHYPYGDEDQEYDNEDDYEDDDEIYI